MGGPPSDADAEVSAREFDWSTGPDGGVDGSSRRRYASAVLVTLVVVVGLLSAVAYLPGGASARASFTGSDVSVTSNSGVVTSLTVGPSGNVTYDGLEREPSTTHVVVEVRVADGPWTRVGNETIDVSGLEGTASFDFSTISVLNRIGATPADFRPTDGSTKDVDLDVTLVDAGPGGVT